MTLTGCQLSYYLHSGYNQAKLANARRPIDLVLKSKKLSDEEKRKLQLVQQVKRFAEDELGLKASNNYTTFVQLEDPYVTYIVQAAHAWELKPYLWSFPLVGKVPYKGYFRKDLAEAEAKEFDPAQFDTYVRGVSAYSTLGWLQDSVLSSMLRYEDHDLVDLIIHETIHTTLYIKSAAEFNERLATFMGHQGMKIFYLKTEGPRSKNLVKADEDTADQKLFSRFITEEVEQLKKWYESNKNKITAEKKRERLKEIQARYITQLKPKLKTKNYQRFEKAELNNAMLLAYRTYEYNLEDFEKLFERFNRDFKKTIEFLKTLRHEKNPDQKVKELLVSN